MSSNSNNTTITTTKTPLSSTTTCTTVIKPLGEEEARAILKNAGSKQVPSQQPQQQLQHGGGPRRAPIEEASLPQPRSPPVHDTANEPTLISQVSNKLSKAMHNMKESAEEVADKIKESVVGTAHKADQVLESAASKVEGAAKRASDKVERAGESAKNKIEHAGESAKNKIEHAGESAKQNAQDLAGRAREKLDHLKDRMTDDKTTREWAEEEKRIRERVSRDFASRREKELQSHLERTDELGSEHHGTWDSIKEWWRGTEHHDHDHNELSELSDLGRTHSGHFDEGAEMAKQQAFKRLNRLAKETERKIEEARRAADEWERGAREQVGDAWENARTHSMHIMREQQQSSSHSLPVGSLAQTLKQIKDDNKRQQLAYMRDVCESHSNRPQCYDTVKKLLGLAKENARIKVALEDKHMKTH